ncbi:MAG: AMP-binding protein [Pseudomonadales bacterium]
MATENAHLEDFKTPLEMFYRWEAEVPDAVWLRQSTGGEWNDYSWGEAGGQSRKLATALQAMGLQKDDKVGIYAANSPQWIMADLAIMMAGMVTVPIYTTMPPDKVSYVAEHSDMKALFVDASIDIDKLRALVPAGTSLIAMSGVDSERADASWDGVLQAHAPVEGKPLRDPDDLFTIVYTSGTTGMPKGVMHSFATLPHSAFAIPQIAGSDTSARLFSYLPLAHVAERVLVELHSLYSGASIGFNESKDTFADDLKAIRPTFFFAVPRIWVNLKAGIVRQLGDEAWQKILDDPQGASAMGKPILGAMGLDEVTFAFSGAAPISTKDIEAWQALGMPLFEGFGQSEIMSGTCNLHDACRIGTVGKIIDTNFGELRISEEGEVLLRAPGAMLGYYKAPDKTAETIVDGWVRTGDKGAIDEDGFLRITGRVKEIFKTAKGKYVAPAPVENRFVASCPYVDQLCLVGSGLPQTVLLVNLTEASKVNSREEISAALEQTRQEVNQAVEAHERMSHVVVCNEPWTIENGLLTHTLKILRDDVERNHAAAIERTTQAKEGDTVIWESEGAVA